MFSHPLTVVDYSGAVVDAVHLCATISGHLPAGAIKDSWSGWAGDLASSIEDIVLKMRGTGLDDHYESIIGVAQNYFFSSAGKFSKDDLNADVDAEGIAALMRNNTKIDIAMETYYTNKASSRYLEFINRHGGNDWNSSLSLNENTTFYLLLRNHIHQEIFLEFFGNNWRLMQLQFQLLLPYYHLPIKLYK